MIVVSDTSVLAAVSALGLHELLAEMFGDIHVPRAAWNELAAAPDKPNRKLLLSRPWLICVDLTDRSLAESLSETLDPGECEVIAYAVTHTARLVLLDDLGARRAAESLDLRVTGVVGLLLEAKRQGRIDLIAPTISMLRLALGFHLSEHLVRTVLRQAGEL